MLIIESTKIEFTGGHIENMLILETPKIEFTGSHTGIMLIIEYENRTHWRPCWKYAKYRDF